MTALGLRPNAATYALLMEAHAAAGDVDGAEAAFKEMSAGGTAPDSTAWAALLRAHGMAADLPGLGQAYEELLLQWDDPSIEDLDAVYAAAFEAVRTATAGIRVRARSARHAAGVHHPAADYGEQHLHSGSAKESSESSYQSHENRPAPDAFSYGAALNGGPGAQDAGYRLATALLQRMEGDAQRLLGQGKSLPPPALAALIGAHGNLGHADAVARIVGAAYGPQQQQRGILSGSGIPASKASPPSEGGKSPLKPSARPSIEAQVLEALDLKPPSRKEAALGLTACRSAPDIRVVNAALAAFGRSGRLDLCIALLKRMKSLRLSADAQTYTALILACVSPPMPALARHLLTHAAEAGVPMTIRAYNALLQVVCAAQGVDAYSGVIGIMAEAGVQPDSFTWMALRSAALMQRRPDVAEHADMELRALQHGTHGAKYHAVQSEVVPDDAIGAEDGADGKESGEGDGTAGQKHWKGYYASDDEDEW